MALSAQTILLVEDDPNDAAMTLRALSKQGITTPVVHAKDGQEALQILFGQGVQGEAQLPRVVLLDLKLPKLNGMEVLELIRTDERTRWLPVVILTSSDEEQDVQRGYRLGANSFVRKPVEYAQFIEVIGRLGHYWTVENRVGAL
jgi:two-component system response regulator